MDLLDALRKGMKKQVRSEEEMSTEEPTQEAPGAFTRSEDLMPKRQVVDFFDALRKVSEGARITKLEWQDRDWYGLLKDGLLVIHNGGEAEDVFHAWLINDGDLLGVDFVVLP